MQFALMPFSGASQLHILKTIPEYQVMYGLFVITRMMCRNKKWVFRI
jgi:hypothetical protein